MTQYGWLKSKALTLGGSWFGAQSGSVDNRRSRRSHRGPVLECFQLESRFALSADLTAGMESLYTDPITGQTYELDAFPPVASDMTGNANSTASSAGSAPSSQLYSLSSIPVLNSYPGAKATIYLDFVGDYESSWGSYSQIATPAYDTDGDPTTFSAAELTAIQNIWSYVSEDYSPFNVNVTTVAPPNFENGEALKVVIGGSGSWMGQAYGGISYVGSFSNSMPNVSFVFPKNLGNGNARYTADAISHEVGHDFGLSHQSTYSGAVLTQEYSTANVKGATPLMGNSYSAIRSTWWYGTSDASSTSYQDDMAVISSATNGFGYRAESAGTTAATATFLFNSSNQISASGVILTGSDVNYYAFLANAGAATFTVQAAAGFNNLVPTIEIYDSTGAVLLASASASQNGATATIATNLSEAGSYRLVVRGDGSYGNAGQYTVSGAIAIPSASLFVAVPSNVSASVVSAAQIQVSWSADNGNGTGYLVQRNASGGAWSTIANLPAGTTSYSDASVAAGGSYGYRVIAYNPFMTSSPSPSAFAMSPVVLTGPPPAVSGLFVSSRMSNAVSITWGGGSGTESGYQISRSINNGKTWTVITVVSGDMTSFIDRSVKAGKRYAYRVVAFNAMGNASPSNPVFALAPKFQGGQFARHFQLSGRAGKQRTILAKTVSAPDSKSSFATAMAIEYISPLPTQATLPNVFRVSWTPVIS